MKPFFISLAMCIALIACWNEAYAKDPSPKLATVQQVTIEKNILAGLRSPVMDIRADMIQLLIDLKRIYPSIDFDYAVLPLMGCLKSEECEELRILAALALVSFDSEKAHWAVERRGLYDPSERVARHCQDFARMTQEREKHS